MSTPVLVLADLRVRSRGETPRDILSGLSLEVAAGECVALCGPSGSGKSTACLAPFGMTAPNLEVSGTGWLAGVATAMAGRQQPPGRVAFVLQEPTANFAPHLSIGDQLNDLAKDTQYRAWLRWGAQLGLVEMERLLRQLPEQCSGGELQRLALVAALAQHPQLLVADEPTAALDSASRDAWCCLVREHCAQGLAVLLVSHDETVLQAVADRRVTLDARGAAPGPVSPLSPVSTLAPARGLTQEPPAGWTESERVRPAVLLRMEVAGRKRTNAMNPTAPLRFALPAGGCIALMGPSGSGKTGVLHAVLGLPTPLAARVEWAGCEVLPWPAPSRRSTAGRMAVVPQDARLALNPYRPLVDGVATAFTRRGHDRITSQQRARDELQAAGIAPEHWSRRPATLSVGQAQRAALAQAMAVRPALLICDEPTSAQDPWHRELVVRCLQRARCQHGVALLLATHDMPLAAALGATLVRLGE